MTETPSITILAKDPPGGRCKLYFKYADALKAVLGSDVAIEYPADDAPVSAPNMTANGQVLEPEDYFMLNPDDICRGLTEIGISFDADVLHGMLEAIEEKFMEDVGTGG